MSLNGRLADFPLAEVLQLLGRGRHTGVLSIVTELCSTYGAAIPAAAKIHFAEGKIIKASAGSRMRLGSQLLAKGVLTAEMIRTLIDTQRSVATPKPLGAMLIEAGILCPDALKGELQSQILQVIELVLDWRSGEFVFDTSGAEGCSSSPDDGEGLAMDLVLLEVHRQRDEALLDSAPAQQP